MMRPALLALEKALNRYLSLDPEAANQLSGLEGKRVRIEFTDVQWVLDLFFYSTHVSLSSPRSDFPEKDDHCDASIKGSTIDFLKQVVPHANSEAPNVTRFKVSGDVELAQQVNQLLHDVNIDWEEHLSKIVGDSVAHRIGQMAHNVSSWGQRAVKHFRADASEYLQEESQNLPSQVELTHFSEAVTTLRHDVERFAARLKLMRSKAGEGQ